MSFWDGVASFGLGVQGFNDYKDQEAERNYRAKKRARDEEVSALELERIRRDDDLAKKTREIAKKYGLNGDSQLPAVSQEIALPQLAVDDEGYPMPKATKTVDLPAQANRGGMYDAMAQELEAAGKIGEAEKIRAALKAMETEGYTEIIKGVASGEDPALIAQRFNQKGRKRIVNADRDEAGAVTFTYEDGKAQRMTPDVANDLGTKLGIFKKDTVIIPEGATLAEQSTGRTLARGQPKQHNIDPLSPEGIKAKQEFETWKSNLAKKEGGDPAKIREVRALADMAFGGDIEKAVEYAYGVKDTDRTSQVMRMMSILKSDDALSQDQNKLRAKAEEIVDGLRARESKGRGGVRPGGKKDEGSDIQKDLEDANRRDAAKKGEPPPTIAQGGVTYTYAGKTKSGKPLYKAPNGDLMVGE